MGRLGRQLLYTLILLAFLNGCAAFCEERWFALDVNPRVSQTTTQGGTMTVRLIFTIPRNDQNRVLCFGYDGPVFRASCVEHVAQAGAYRVEQAFSGLKPGRYVAFGELRRQGVDGKVESRLETTNFVICGDGGCEVE